MSVQIKLRRDTAANWVIVNPVLAAGEPGVETDTLKWKFGDGTTHWNQLNYPTILSTPTAARDLTGTTLPANIINSSLTSVGTLAHLTVTNPINASITGNAATATAAVNATNAINAQSAVSASVASSLSGGTANQIMYQTGSGTGFITVPALPTTFLEWNGTGFNWASIPPSAANAVTGNTLASNVVNSSLTSVGTLTNLTVTNTITGSVTGSAGSVSGANITGSTLASNVLTSSLTSVGTLTNLAVTNPIAGSVTGAAGSVAAGNITGSTLASNVQYFGTSGSGTITVNNDLTVTGNLTVNGTTTTINSTVLSVDDKNIELGSIASPTDTTANGGGITLKGTTDKTINWVSGTSAWTSSENVDIASGRAYYVNGTSVLNSTTLGSGVTSSSLTSFGSNPTLSGASFTNSATVSGGSLTFSGNITAPAWTTTGIRHISVGATLTDTTSTGTVTNAYTNTFGGNSIAATNATTFTNYGTMFVNTPTAGTNVTITNPWSIITSGNILVRGSIIDSTTTISAFPTATSITLGNATGATLTLNPGTLVGANTTQNVFNTVATTVNAFGSSTLTTIGATSSATLTLNPGTISTSVTSGSLALFNTGLTGTLNFAGAATTLNIGSSSSTAKFGGSVLAGGAIGYQTGVNAGSTVTQTGGRTSAVTISYVSGAITLFSSTTAAGQTTSFTVNNTTVVGTDIIATSVKGGTSGVYFVTVTGVANSVFTINVYTPTAVGSAEAPTINFAVIKGTSN
jgi:hypothetical protein